MLMAVPIILVVLHLLPWIHAAGELQKTTLCSAAAFVVLFFLCLLSSPFDGDISPNRILFSQEYNASETLSTVALITGSAYGTLQETLGKVLPSNEFETMECEPYLTYQTRCTYKTSLVPLYGRAEDISVLIEPPRLCWGSKCNVNLTTSAFHSSLCQLEFSNQNISGLNAYVNTRGIEKKANDTMHAVAVYTKSEGDVTKWDLSFDFNGAKEAGQAVYTCFYDDWTEGELPAFTYLRDNLPIQNLVTMKGGVGLARVHYATIPLINTL